MNVWQGEFPSHNTLADGHYGTCAVDGFAPNGYGLRNTTGERVGVDRGLVRPGLPCAGPLTRPERAAGRYASGQKGGSYRCHASYCRRYRVAARQANTPDASAGNLGFRCASEPASPGEPETMRSADGQASK